MTAMCRTAGFARVELNSVHEYGAAATCYRKWSAPPDPAPARLLAAIHAESFGINFRSDRDDYVACCLDGEPVAQPTVGDFGVHPIFNGRTASGFWQMNFKLPPGLAPGWHPVRVGGSNAIEIAVDVPLEVGSLHIASACDGVSWEQGRASLAGGHLSLWVEGLPRNADVHNVGVTVDGVRQRVTYVGTDGQVNVRLQGVEPGSRLVLIACGERDSPSTGVEFTP
jgi:hypothetical protein